MGAAHVDRMLTQWTIDIQLQGNEIITVATSLYALHNHTSGE